jgi:hypothetical protein
MVTGTAGCAAGAAACFLQEEKVETTAEAINAHPRKRDGKNFTFCALTEEPLVDQRTVLEP